MKGRIKQHKISWLKVYILLIVLVSTGFLGFKVFVQAQTPPPLANFCAKNENVNANSVVIACSNNYHVEGKTCASNTPPGYKFWIGNAFNGILFNPCGNGYLDSGEACDGMAGVATSPADSTSSRQYACTSDCQPTGGYLGDGIKQETYGEICDTKPGSGYDTQPCSSEFDTPCGSVISEGTQTCQLNGQWGECEGGEPVPGDTTPSSGCGSVPVNQYDFACCELVGCSNDSCGCCGWDAGTPYYEDLNYTLTSAGYAPTKFMGPCNGAECQCWRTTDPKGFCDCADPGCQNVYYEHHGPGTTQTAVAKCNVNNNACAIGQSTENSRNWKIISNHATAIYKCYK